MQSTTDYKFEKMSLPYGISVFALLLALLFILSPALPVGIDWRDTYRPAALAMARGDSPYSVPIYYAAPWGAALLIPLALLPYALGRLLLFAVSLIAFAWVGIRLGAKPVPLLLFLTSAAVMGCLNNGNIEFLPLLGVIAPPWLGLILFAIKPQVGIGLAIFWVLDTWKREGFPAVLRMVFPVSLMLSASFIIYGPWPIRFSETLERSVDNTSLFPWSIPLGLALLYVGYILKWKTTALAASPLLSPYVLQFTWVSLLVNLLDRPRFLFFAWVMLWIPVLLRVFF